MIDACSPTLYPGIPMSRYGLVPEEYGGGNKYRLIWAPSRKVILTGKPGTMTVGMYADTPLEGGKVMPAVEPLNPSEVWILEKWLDPWDATGMTPKQWKSDPTRLNMGPYPSKGEYCMAATPLTCSPDQANIDKLIMWVEKRVNPYQNSLAIRDDMEKGQKNRRRLSNDRIRGALLPFGGEAYASGHGHGRGTKTVNTDRSANELGLPTQSGYSGASPIHKPVTYEVPNAGI